MGLQVGSIIKSTQALSDTHFESATIVITEYDNNGAVGFAINKPFPHNLNELEEFKHIPAFPLYEGGPVDQEHLYFLHRRPDMIEGGTRIAAGVYFGGDFKQAVQSIQNNSFTTGDIKIFIGYCGWDAGELEEELKEGSWIISPNDENIFTSA